MPKTKRGYGSSPRVWRCWHCDDVFRRPQDAAEHFGGNQGALTGCQIKGSDGGLLGLVRKQEVELARLRAEDSDLIRVMRTMEGEHIGKLMRAEEKGYGKAVRDMQAMAVTQFGEEIKV